MLQAGQSSNKWELEDVHDCQAKVKQLVNYQRTILTVANGLSHLLFAYIRQQSFTSFLPLKFVEI